MSDAANGHPRELLSDYLDDQVGVEARTSIDRHLADCEDCRAELDALRRLARAVADEEVPPVPPDLPARISRSLDGASGVRPRGRRFVMPATIAATLAAIGILVALQWRQGDLGVPATPESVSERPVFSEPSPPKAPPPLNRPEEDGAPLEEKKEDAAQKANVVPGGVESVVEGGVVGGAVGGAEGGAGHPAERQASADEDRRDRLRPPAKDSAATAPSAAPRAKTAPVSSCVDRWSDSGLRGAWIVPDASIAVRELGRIADDVGGIGEWRGIADGRPYVLIVPRNRFDEVFYALRARGVTGLMAVPTLDAGVDCAGISVALSVVPAASPAPSP
jgi:hypothetical protein